MIDSAAAERIFREAAEAYIGGCRARLKPFVDRHFRLAGAARVHRSALGPDLLRAPANLVLAVAHAVVKLLAVISRPLTGARVADWLERRNLLLRTDVDREVEWLIHTELLVLPFSQPTRTSERDGLVEAMLAHPEVERAMQATLTGMGPAGGDAQFRRRLEDNLRRYTGTRAAASDIAAGRARAGSGAIVLKKLTPRARSLGPAMAAVTANQAAIAGFPLGSWLGGVWYGMFPVSPSNELVWGVTGGLMVVASVVAAFAGLFADPVQRLLGIHRRRLGKFIDTIEHDLMHGHDKRLAVRAHYVARLLDLFEFLRAASRAAL